MHAQDIPTQQQQTYFQLVIPGPPNTRPTFVTARLTSMGNHTVRRCSVIQPLINSPFRYRLDDRCCLQRIRSMSQFLLDTAPATRFNSRSHLNRQIEIIVYREARTRVRSRRTSQRTSSRASSRTRSRANSMASSRTSSRTSTSRSMQWPDEQRKNDLQFTLL